MPLASLIKPFIPPVALPLARSVERLVRRPEWEHVPEGWREDDPRGTGWHHPSVVEAQRRRWPDFVAAVRGTGPLGVGHEAVRVRATDPQDHNALLTFAYVLGRAAVGREGISVLDWGGGLGYHAVVARAVLPEIAFDYTVEEIPGVCEAGRELAPDVRFTSGGEEALGRAYDLVFVSNALQYCRDWEALLRRLAAAATRWVYVTRLPVVERAGSHVVVQRPHWAGYHTEYLSWVFGRSEFLAAAAGSGLALEREFLLRDGPPGGVAGAPAQFRECGFLFRR